MYKLREFLNNKRRLYTVGGLAVLVLAAAGLILLWPKAPKHVAALRPAITATPSAAASPSPSASSPARPSASPGVDVLSVPASLLEASANVNGVAIGYLQHELASAGRSWLSWLWPDAQAASYSYAPTVFFTKQVSGRDQIFALDALTKASAQATADPVAASDAVFSSVSQNLAYMRGYASGDGSTSTAKCDLVVKNMVTNAVTNVETPTIQYCFRPIAWSPNGSQLLFASMNNVLGSAGWDLGALYLYTPGKGVKAIPMPAGFNTFQDYDDAIWTSDTTVEVRFIDKGQQGVTLSSGVELINSTSLAESATSTTVDGLLDSIIKSGTSDYFETSKPTQAVAVASSDGTGAKQVISGTTSAGSFLLEFGQGDATASSVVFTDGQPGNAGSFHLQTVPIGGGSPLTLFSPSGYSAYMLGWAGNYSQFLWMSVDSGTSAIHEYNLSTKQDVVIASGLSLVQ